MANKYIHPDNVIKYLNEINRDKKTRSEFEDAIRKINHCRMYMFDNNKSFNVGLKNIVQDSVNNLSDKFNISKEAVVLYFRLDRDIYHKVNEDYCGFVISGLDTSKFDLKYSTHFASLSGSNLEYAYKNNYDDIISFLHANCDLFPSSSRTYLKAKKREYASKPVISSLNNGFKAKSWAISLPEEFKITHFRNILSFFKKNNSELDSLVSFGYVYTTVLNKYPDNKRAIEFCYELSLKLCTSIGVIFSDSSYADKVLSWNSIGKMLQDCDDLRSKVINDNIGLGYKGHFSILLESIVSDKEDKDALLLEQDKFFCSLFNTDYFKLQDCPVAQKDALILSYKKQYFKKFGIKSDFLDK